MVLAAKQRSLYELTDAISAQATKRARWQPAARPAEQLGCRRRRGHRPSLYAGADVPPDADYLEKNVRDSRAIWQALWQGFRMPPFAAEDLIRQARRYKTRRELTRARCAWSRARTWSLRSSPPDKRLVLERLVRESYWCVMPARLMRELAAEVHAARILDQDVEVGVVGEMS
jgi:DNA polymerase-3 subunit delta